MLKLYLDSGVINDVSSQDSFSQCATPSWSTEKAQQRAESILASYDRYKDVDI